MSFNWKTTKLGEVCDVRRGSSPRPIQNFLSDTGMPWVKIADATAESTRYIKHTNEFIKMEGVQKSVIVTPGTLIVSNSGTAGLPKFMAITACVHDGWLVLTRLRSILPDFLYYTILVSRRGLLHNAYDSVMKNLTIDMIRDLEVSLPTLEKQENITNILKALDDKIELNIAINKNLEEMAQALFKRWFVDFEFPNENGEPYKSSGGEFEESELGLIPKGWKTEKIENCTKFVSRGIAPKYDENSEKRVINQKCIRDGSLNTALSRTHCSNVSEEKKIVFGDILVNSTGMGTLGRVAQVYEHLENYTVDSHVTIIRPSVKNGLGYMGCLLKNMQPIFEHAATGSTGQTELGREAIKQMKILLPDQRTIEGFSGIYHSFCEKMLNYQKDNVVLSNVRDTLLPKFMSGEIRVPVEQEYTQPVDLPMVAESSEKYSVH